MICVKCHIQYYRVSHKSVLVLNFFCHFLGQSSFKTQKLGKGNSGTRILKIDSEMAEIIEVKVATCHIEIIFLPLWNSKISISKMRGSYFWIDFQNSCAYHLANWQIFPRKWQKTKSRLTYGTPCSIHCIQTVDICIGAWRAAEQSTGRPPAPTVTSEYGQYGQYGHGGHGDGSIWRPG